MGSRWRVSVCMAGMSDLPDVSGMARVSPQSVVTADGGVALVTGSGMAVAHPHHGQHNETHRSDDDERYKHCLSHSVLRVRALRDAFMKSGGD